MGGGFGAALGVLASSFEEGGVGVSPVCGTSGVSVELSLLPGVFTIEGISAEWVERVNGLGCGGVWGRLGVVGVYFEFGLYGGDFVLHGLRSVGAGAEFEG